MMLRAVQHIDHQYHPRFRHHSEGCGNAWPSCRTIVRKVRHTTLQSLQGEGQVLDRKWHDSYQVLLKDRRDLRAGRASAKLTKTYYGFSEDHSASDHQHKHWGLDSWMGNENNWVVLASQSLQVLLTKWWQDDSAMKRMLKDVHTMIGWAGQLAGECAWHELAQVPREAKHTLGMMNQESFGHMLWWSLRLSTHFPRQVQKRWSYWVHQGSYRRWSC